MLSSFTAAARSRVVVVTEASESETDTTDAVDDGRVCTEGCVVEPNNDEGE